MDRGKIQSEVVAALEAVQTLSGKEYVSLGANDKPIGRLDGFDSLCGVEATVMIEGRIGCEINRDSLFVTEDGNQAATLEEICDYLEGVNCSQTKSVA